MSIDNITIKEAREIAKMFNANAEQNDRMLPDGKLSIAVLQRGWAFVGTYSQTGSVGRLEGASCIRRWGTTNGLGELAEKGPLEDTILDACPPVVFQVREAIVIMEVNENAWGK